MGEDSEQPLSLLFISGQHHPQAGVGPGGHPMLIFFSREAEL
jgi:hypothetical protein